MDSLHRKIDLQSPQDLTYLLDNLKRVAQEKLDSHFPPYAAPQGEKDELRAKVEEYVNQFIQKTYTLALPSLAINGLDASPSILTAPSTSTTPSKPRRSQEPIYEDYDPRLQSKLQSLYTTLESEATKVAELRREAPQKAARAYLERLEREIVEEEGRFLAARGLVGRNEEGGLGGIKLERMESVKERFESAVTKVEGLKGVTETVGKLERGREVVKVLEGM
ncbi:MAG: hypothetical protein MMC33_001662 [Icmadophila ericetorum]|nr:hypothetical protein [Icmadophila ericetorum]